MRLTELLPLFIDAQTTAATPGPGRLLELAWRHGENPTESRVIRADVDEEVPPRILRMTGITRTEIEAGASEDEVFQALCAACAGTTVAMIHFATFEARFLADLWRRRAGAAFPLEIICTHAIAQRLLPKLPSRSLRAIAGFFGAEVGELKRAAGHVDATAHIWRRLAAELEAHAGVATLDALRAWLAQKAKRHVGAKQFPLDRTLRLALPDAPGVYRMLGYAGQVLYVGKATSLKSRVNSYFRQRRGQTGLKNEMLTQVVGVEVTACETALEAALLESDEIKRLSPRYNIALRMSERTLGYFDRSLATVAPDDPAATLGPFSSVQALDGLKLIAGAILADEGAAGGLAPALFLAALVHDEIAESTLAAGLSLFKSSLPFRAASVSPRKLLAHGAILARRRADKDCDDEEPAEEAAVERTWEPDDVARLLEMTLADAGRALRRSHRLRLLANATVVVRNTEPRENAAIWRYLTFAGGRLAATGWVDDPDDAPRTAEPLPLTPDGRTYDRVRVLSTELLRITDAHIL